MTGEQVERWHDHFESNGWRVSGKAPMADWKAALRNGKDFATHQTNGHHKPRINRNAGTANDDPAVLAQYNIES